MVVTSSDIEPCNKTKDSTKCNSNYTFESGDNDDTKKKKCKTACKTTFYTSESEVGTDGKCYCKNVKKKCGEYSDDNGMNTCDTGTLHDQCQVSADYTGQDGCNTQEACTKLCTDYKKEYKGTLCKDTCYCTNETPPTPPEDPSSETCKKVSSTLMCPSKYKNESVSVLGEDVKDNNIKDYYTYNTLLKRKDQLYAFCGCDNEIKKKYDDYFGDKKPLISKLWKESIRKVEKENCDLYTTFKEKLNEATKDEEDGLIVRNDKLNTLIAYEMCRITNRLHDRKLQYNYPAFTQEWLDYYLSENSDSGKIFKGLLQFITVFILLRILLKTILPGNPVKDPKISESLFLSLFTNKDMYESSIQEQLKNNIYSLFTVVTIIVFVFFHGKTHFIPSIIIYILIFVSSIFLKDITDNSTHIVITFVFSVLFIIIHSFTYKEKHEITNKEDKDIDNPTEEIEFTSKSRNGWYKGIIIAFFLTSLGGSLYYSSRDGKTKPKNTYKSMFSYLAIPLIFLFAPEFRHYIDTGIGILSLFAFIIIGSVIGKFSGKGGGWSYAIGALVCGVIGLLLFLSDAYTYKSDNFVTGNVVSLFGIILLPITLTLVFLIIKYDIYKRLSVLRGGLRQFIKYILIPLFILTLLVFSIHFININNKNNKNVDDEDTTIVKDKEELEAEYDYEKTQSSTFAVGCIFMTLSFIILVSIIFNNNENIPHMKFISFTFTSLLGLLPLFVSIVLINFSIGMSHPGIELLLLILYRFLSFIPSHFTKTKYISILKRPTDEWVIPFTPLLSIFLLVYSKLSGTPLPKYFSPTGYKTSSTNHEIFIS